MVQPGVSIYPESIIYVVFVSLIYLSYISALIVLVEIFISW